jgi:uncharacterized membrane protein
MMMTRMRMTSERAAMLELTIKGDSHGLMIQVMLVVASGGYRGRLLPNGGARMAAVILLGW